MLEKFLAEASKDHARSLTFPKWSKMIFEYDLEHYPLKDPTDAYLLLNNPPYSYLEFFEKTRGFPRPLNGKDDIWRVFQQGSLILYFDQLFFRMLSEPLDIDEKLLRYLDILGKAPVPQWDYLVQGFGAACIDFFIRDPEIYCTLNKDNTDHALLARLGKRLVLDKQPDEISRQESRNAILQRLSTRLSSPTE